MPERPQTIWGWVAWVATVMSGVAGAAWLVWTLSPAVRPGLSGFLPAVGGQTEETDGVTDTQSTPTTEVESDSKSRREALEPRTEAPDRSRKASSQSGNSFSVRSGDVVLVNGGNISVSWVHNELQGMQLASMTISPAEGPTVVKAALAAGMEVPFNAAGTSYLLQVVAIDWKKDQLSFRIKTR